MLDINGFDIAIFLIFAYCVSISFVRGFVGSLISSVVFIASFVLTSYMREWINHNTTLSEDFVLWNVLGTYVVFLCCLVFCYIAGIMLMRVTEPIRMHSIDRAVGISFGFLRGGFYAVLLVAFASGFLPNDIRTDKKTATSLDQNWLQQSLTFNLTTKELHAYYVRPFKIMTRATNWLHSFGGKAQVVVFNFDKSNSSKQYAQNKNYNIEANNQNNQPTRINELISTSYVSNLLGDLYLQHLQTSNLTNDQSDSYKNKEYKNNRFSSTPNSSYANEEYSSLEKNQNNEYQSYNNASAVIYDDDNARVEHIYRNSDKSEDKPKSRWLYSQGYSEKAIADLDGLFSFINK